MYYLVIIVFAAVCIGMILYSLIKDKRSISEISVLDDKIINYQNNQINDYNGYLLKNNKFFENWVLLDAK